MTSYYWLECDDCHEKWIGEPYRKDGSTERCPECGSDEMEIGESFARKIPSLYPLILIVPSFLLWGAM